MSHEIRWCFVMLIHFKDDVSVSCRITSDSVGDRNLNLDTEVGFIAQGQCGPFFLHGVLSRYAYTT